MENPRTDESGETMRLARFCADLAIDDLDEAVVDDVQMAVADFLAASFAGTPTEAGRILIDYVATMGGGDATVVGGRTAPAPFAALANGTTGHALELDDGHRGASAHPGVAVVPAALAVAEKYGVHGSDLVVAVAAGYEAVVKTADSVQPSHRERGFHATATCGCIGAAAAVGSVLDLDADSMADAIGLGGTQAGGLFEFLAKGSMAKRFHPGRAALAGVLAGELAARGFDGPDTIIEGVDGFARAYADDYDRSRFDSLGDPFEVTRVYFKPYPCCRHVHGPIEAAFELRERVPPKSVASIRVETYGSASKHDKRGVENLLDAQMSVPYGVAVAYVVGEAGLAQYDPPSDDPAVRRLAELTAVVATDEMEARYPESRPARVVVETDDGGREEAFVEYPTGAAENPMTEGRLREKFHDVTGSLVSRERRERILDVAFDLPALEDVSTLTAEL